MAEVSPLSCYNQTSPILSRFEFSICADSSTHGCGHTLFASSRRFFQFLPSSYSIESFEKATWKLRNHDMGGCKEMKGLPLVVQHPVQHTPCLRWHQPWPATRISSRCEVTVENSQRNIEKVIDNLLYDRRVCLRFSWEIGDVLLLDNTAMLHAKTPYLGEKDREIWRVHLN